MTIPSTTNTIKITTKTLIKIKHIFIINVIKIKIIK